MEKNKQVFSFYEKRFKEYGDSILSLGWEKPQEQIIRFKTTRKKY